MKKLFFGVLAIAGLVACVQEDVLNAPNLKNEIGFGGYVNGAVRTANPSTTTESIDHFTVWAYMDDKDGNVLTGELVSKSGDAWVYSNVQYWLKKHQYHFFALSPYKAGEANNAVVDLSEDPYTNYLGGLAYTNVEGTEDLLYATATPDTFQSIPEHVQFDFDHLLSKVKFTFVNGFTTDNIDIAVTEVTMTAPKNAETTLGAQVHNGYVWTNHAGETVLDLGDAAEGARIDATKNAASDNERLTFPAQVADNLTYIVKFKVAQYVGSQTTAAATYDLESTVTGVEFVAGKAYNFVAIIDNDVLDLKKIEFKVTVDEWDLPVVEESVDYFIDKANGNYVAVTAQGLRAIAEGINAGTIDSDVNITLNGNIDLAATRSASNWTPIGTSEKPYTGTFDGKDFKVSNLVIDGGSSSNIGFFGVTHNGEIKNLVIENAKVSGRLNVGVVAGTPYTSKYSNITVTGHVEVDGMAYVGAVGGKNAYANWSNITVNVDETSYVNANSIENGNAYRTYVGGVIGFCGEGGHTFSNIRSNIDVKGSTCDVGGIVGIAHYGNNFVNCVCEGDVEIYNASEEADVQEIGGIAGVWHNENGTKVTFTNCQFTGELKANNNYVINTNKFGKLVCAAYGKGTGVLNIDGKLYTVAAPGETVNGSVVADNTEEGQTALKENAANGKDVILVSDVTTIDSGSNGYGATGINVNGGTLDGNGYTLEVEGATSTWDSAVAISSGTIKNITIAKGFRGIFIKTSKTGEPVILDNVTINGPTYTISCDSASKQGIIATNCTILGWTSYAGTIGWAKFTNCSFGKGAGYAFARPYATTEFVNCDFAAGYKIDARAAVTFENCTIAGVALTADNLATLVTSNIANATVK